MEICGGTTAIGRGIDGYHGTVFGICYVVHSRIQIEGKFSSKRPSVTPFSVPQRVSLHIIYVPVIR